MKFLIFLLALFSVVFSVPYSAQAQFVKDQEYLVNSNLKSRGEPTVYFLEKSGMLIIQPDGKKPFSYLVTCLDTQFQVRWQSLYKIPFFFSGDLKKYFDNYHGYFYILAQEAAPSNKASVLKIDLSNGVMNYQDFKLSMVLDINDFKVLDENLFISGVYRYKSIILQKMDGETTTRILPGFYDRHISIQNITEDFISNNIYFFIKDRQDCQTSIYPYSNILGLQKKIEVPGLQNYNFNNVLIKSIESKKKLVLGTFAHHCSNFPQGAFSLAFSPSNPEFLQPKFFRFVDLVNFYSHLPKRQEQLKEAASRKRKRGREHKLYNKMIFHNKVYDVPQGVVLSVEGYGESYKVFNNSNQRSVTQVFDGYIPRYATLIGFDEDGNKKWDNYIKFSNIKNMTLRPNVQLGSLGDSLVLTYFNDIGLTSKFIYQSESLQNEVMQTYKDLFPNSYTSEQVYNFVHLEDNYFVLHGAYFNPVSNEKITYLRRMRFDPNAVAITESAQKKKKKNN